ncbi:hypothetical protein TSUD_56090 [Trifolium subterraneum]|uniref:F-box associated beta-propeller type 3 domain-containing protein n=1 Tax=Trifolium subterraneum TaxID=3900 RepID=A0A2Z6M2E9_TRISU|nr:hypothetical protein TSUD_56090 [Trifolium subterraneum]
MPSESFSDIEIKGSCRGFILLHCSSAFYLWNPSTGLHKKIPLSPFRFDLDEDSEYFYGFGYDQLTDDYLIVSISYDIIPPYLEFFSLRANTWKQIDSTHIHHSYANEDLCTTGTLFNGAIHWFAYCLDLQEGVIVVFDLVERKLLDMHLPDEFDFDLEYFGLWIFQEFLSLWAKNYDNDTVDIWVMKEYKVHSSWIKTHVLPIDAIPTKYISPLCSTKSGDIVGTDDRTRLVKYNDEGQLLGCRSYCNNRYEFEVAMYTESLLSLPRDNAANPEYSAESNSNASKFQLITVSVWFIFLRWKTWLTYSFIAILLPRNEGIFDGRVGDPSELLDDIMMLSWKWYLSDTKAVHFCWKFRLHCGPPPSA